MELIFSGTFVADENGSNDPLRRYTDKTLVIVLPGDLTVFDIGNINPISPVNFQLILIRIFTIILVAIHQFRFCRSTEIIL